MIAGETVDVDVVLSDNPGITGGSVKITFEKTKLKLTNVTNRSETITSPYDGYTVFPITNGIYGLSWDGGLLGENLTGNGRIATLTFEVLDTATVGDSTITVSDVDFTNFNLDVLTGTGVNGKVTLYSKLTGDLPVAIAKPEKGNTPETAISGTNYTGSITWTPTDTGGKFAANTEYTANVTLTAKTGYQFASDVNPIVTNATSVTDKKVADGGKTLTFKAAFPKTGSVTVTKVQIAGTPPSLNVPEALGIDTPKTVKVTNTYSVTVFMDGSPVVNPDGVKWSVSGLEGVTVDPDTGDELK